MASSSSADTIYTGGNLRLSTSWSNGLPDGSCIGTLDIDVTIAGNYNASGTAIFDVDATMNQTAGTLTGVNNTAVAAGLVFNLSGGTIDNAAGNFNANSGAIFNLSGYELIFGADLIVNNSAGGITVSGDAVISTSSQFDLRLNQDNAFLDIAGDLDRQLRKWP